MRVEGVAMECELQHWTGLPSLMEAGRRPAGGVSPWAVFWQITAVVPLYDADPLTFDSPALMLEATLTQSGQVVDQVYAPVNGHHLLLQLAAVGRSVWMDLALKLKEGPIVRSEAGYRLDVVPSASVLLPAQSAAAVTGQVYVYTAVEEARDALGRTPQQAGWNLAEFDYEGLDSGGTVVEACTGRRSPCRYS